MEGKRAAPFLTKTYAIVDDSSTDSLISWSEGNNSFVVKDPHHFSIHLLPKQFKHCNFSTFVRQLNTYGFRKVDTDRWEFAHESFLRGQNHLLKAIRPRRSSHNLSHTQLGPKYDLEEDEKEDAIVKEVVELKKEQEIIDRELEEMKRRISLIEKRLQQMKSLLQTVNHNQILTAQKLQSGELDSGKKRKLLPIPHREDQRKTRCEFGLDCDSKNRFVDQGLSRISLIASGIEDSGPLVDSEIRAGLFSKEVEKCIEKSDFEIDMGFEKDHVGVNEMLCWDLVIAEETQFINYKILSAMAGVQINKSSDYK